MIKRSLRCYSRDFYTGENIMSKYIGAQMLEFAQKGDERGHLVIIEGMDDIPFDIKRIFYIYGSDKDVITHTSHT